jgi:nitronate monooxygenase
MADSTRRGWQTTPVTERLGIRFPIIQGPFGGGRSTPELAAAATEAGALGSFGAVDLEPAAILEVAEGIRRLTAGPFALNLWVPLDPALEPPPTRARYKATVELLRPYYDALQVAPPSYATVVAGSGDRFLRQLDAVLAARPAVFSFIFGVPPADMLAECRRRGIVTLGTATNVAEADALDAAGVDMIVASGSEAGGHRASFLRTAAESLGVSALVPQIADRTRRPVIAAGGIADGRGMIAALVQGAQGVQVGTAFLVTHESGASEAHKRALVSTPEPSTRLTTVFTGRNARGVVNRFMQEMIAHEAKLPEYPWQGRLVSPIAQAAARTGAADLMPLWAGQNLPLVRRRSVAELMAFLVEDIDRVAARFGRWSRGGHTHAGHPSTLSQEQVQS